MQEVILNKNLLEYDFVAETICQIEKDFQRCNIQINLINLENREQVEQSIYNAICDLPSVKLQQLIYLIDIPEQEFLKIMSKPNAIYSLSEFIFRREALKVYLRKNY